MRSPLISFIPFALILLLLPAAAALAEDFVPPVPVPKADSPCRRLQVGPHGPFLTLSELHLEIETIRQASAQKVQECLEKLAVSQSEEETASLVRMIRQVEMDESICILRVQIRHARKAGQFDLVRRLQTRIVDILEETLQVAAAEVQ